MPSLRAVLSSRPLAPFLAASAGLFLLAGVGARLTAADLPGPELLATGALGSAPVPRRTLSLLPDPPLPHATNLPAPGTNLDLPEFETSHSSISSNPVPASPFSEDLPASPNLAAPVQLVQSSNRAEQVRQFQVQLEMARQQRRARNFELAGRALASLLQTNAPVELKRAGLLELALVAQDENQLGRAQQIFAQFMQLYPQDPAVPEVLLRQALIYRQMGAHNLAVAKFYAVMTSALNLKLDRLDHYQRLVLRAQTEIADTYYLQGKLDEAADFFLRLLRLDSADLAKPPIHFKLVRCLSAQGKHAEVVAQGESFLELYPGVTEVAEVRFLLATALKQLNRNEEALRQVLALLQSQQDAAIQNPETWVYWQKRAGNDVANQLYREGDYLRALELLQHLAALDPSPVWCVPVQYQIGLVYERLQQPIKAVETYDAILARPKPAATDPGAPSLNAVAEMAQWRRDTIRWLHQATLSSLAIKPASTNAPDSTWNN